MIVRPSTNDRKDFLNSIMQKSTLPTSESKEKEKD
jgi:hypothetical protein